MKLLTLLLAPETNLCACQAGNLIALPLFATPIIKTYHQTQAVIIFPCRDICSLISVK